MQTSIKEMSIKTGHNSTTNVPPPRPLLSVPVHLYIQELGQFTHSTNTWNSYGLV